ncbi:TspO/MBR family protein [Micromonospora profundi]|uniref:TspO/MBR family protein n=1 Tax=Micromonospora TaxID=1873 RepID=UPI0006AEF834|nr:TspO/MBR family protein [Micromonospora sp. NRRL B-16802]KOX10915.1 peripheral-type benzodiazepine receptor [Micromonospora sp. NRRL B-16802]
METTRQARPTTGRRSWLALAGFAAAVFVAAAIGGLGVQGTTDEYASLQQPSWAPPSWLFGPVWSALYALIAVAGWLVWRRVGFSPALWAWTAQLVLNAIWTPLFFGAGQYGLAFAEIVLMWLAIGVTVVLFARVSRVAMALMLPYWAWVTFAAALNLSIWQLNS